MNVSSVKNLNGETFSAVQDATLTDVVQSNSASWSQGGTNYTSPSGTILIDGNKLEGTNSAVFAGNYTIANHEECSLSSLPGYPYNKYTVIPPPTGWGRCLLWYGDDFIYSDYWVTDGQPHEIPITSGGENLVFVTPDNCIVEAEGGEDKVVTLALKSDVEQLTATTTLVQGYSATWNDVTNKLDTSAFSDVSGTFLTGVDLSNYYTKSETSGASEIADALANIPTGNPEVESYVQTNSGTIDETVTSYQTNSGTYLTAHQAISANEWNDCYDHVTTNSGAWGGSALPISAGPGIKVNLVDNTLVFSNDETLLWSGNDFTPAGGNNPVSTSVSLNENFNNFNQIRLDFSNGEFFTESVLLTEPTTSRKCYICVKKEQANNGVYIGTHYKFTSDTTLSGYCSYGDTQNINTMTGGYWGYGGVVRVVGINRKQ